jgi:predicted permease
MFRRAWRRLRATPVFTIFSVASLALSIGVTTAIYSLVAFITNRQSNVPNADRIAVVMATDPYRSRPGWRAALSREDLSDLAAASRRPLEIAASAPFSQTLVDDAVSEIVYGEAVTGNYFQKFDATPVQGRLIQWADDGAPGRVVVISHRLWRSRYGARPDAVGRVVRLAGQPFEIVGVAPEGFSGLNDQAQASTSIWVPLGSASMFPSSAAPRTPPDRRRRQLTMIVPVPAEGLAGLSAEMAAISERLDAAYPLAYRLAEQGQPIPRPRAWSLLAFSDVLEESASATARAVGVVMVIVGLVLVVACTNLANLVLARGAGRRHELAVRRALGASRWSLIREQLAETSLLAVFGGIGAFIVMRLLLYAFSATPLPVAQSYVLQLDPRVDAMTLVISAVSLLGALLVFGVGPAMQLTRVSVRSALASDGGSSGQPRWSTRRGLISLQVAISLAFFLISAFTIRIVVAERSRPSGIDIDHLAVGVLSLHLPPWDGAHVRQLVERLTNADVSIEGLESVAVSSGMPFGTTYTPIASVTSTDKPFLPGRDTYVSAPLLAASASIFRTLAVPIVRGRGFDGRDTAATAPVVVISERTARQVFGSTEVVGRELLMRNGINMADATSVKALSIIGVAADTDAHQRDSREVGVVYVPLSQHYEPTLMMVGRTAGDPADAVPKLQALVRRVDPDLVLDRPGPATLVLTGAYVLLHTVSDVAGGLAVLAMVLSMAGLFGVLSHLVAGRTREMGVRLALGAEPSRLRWLVLRDGLSPVAGGVAVGLLIGLLVRQGLSAAYNTPLSTADAIVFALAPLPILMSGIVACYWPARRASRVDPNVALREL